MGNKEPDIRSNVFFPWIEAARILGGSDNDAGDAIFHALIAVMHSPCWSATLSVELDAFPGVPLPADPKALRQAADLGDRLAALLDASVDVPGVTSGKVPAAIAGVAVPIDGGDRRLSAGSRRHGGSWSADTVSWGPSGGWSGVAQEVWDYSLGGYQVLPKWLSYRHGSDLTDDDVRAFTLICRRIQAIVDLHGDCDALYVAADQNPLSLD